tara:strand:- start:197 stop:454 length:258 start_codon:yes stop_codon:yes gene_type:complete
MCRRQVKGAEVMRVNLKYALPFIVFFAPTIAVKLSELMWSVTVSPIGGFWLSLVLGLVASLCSIFWIFNVDDPDIWVALKERDDG